MISKEQEERFNKETILLVSNLILNKLTIKELSELTGISSSTVQRRLNDENRIKNAYSGLKKTTTEIEEIINEIKRILEINKENGLSNGGKTSQERYEMLRDEEGHYNGVVRK